MVMKHLTLLPLLFIVWVNSVVLAEDWPQWGGPLRDLVWRETGIVSQLPSGKLPRVWSVPVGEGYSGPTVADGRVFLTDRVHAEGRSGVERVWAFDAETGAVLWKHEYACEYTISYPAGPRATPTVDGNRVYTIGAVGNMFCFDVATGEVIWSKNFQSDYQTKLPTWGMAAAPLVYGNQLITLVGGPRALLVSFDKLSGKELWRALDDPAIGYCPPVLFNIHGQEQLICWHPHSVTGLDPSNGQILWDTPFHVQAGLTVATPRQVGNRILVTAFYNGSRLIEIAEDGRGAKFVWQGSSDSEIDTDGLHGLMCTPSIQGNEIYGVCSHGQLRCLDIATGKRIWETTQPTGRGRWWNAFLVEHDGRYFIHNEQGELIIAKLSRDGYKELSRSLLVEPTRPVQRRQTIWSHPAFAMRSVFARNDKELVRVSLAEAK
ncbi:MAG: PQQ-like beta-propeller repeat protein [Planctomycetaceae bacterium]|nr:PQQ-like beta-propeller repeat protein [Planctomycetaceae bacterium]